MKTISGGGVSNYGFNLVQTIRFAFNTNQYNIYSNGYEKAGCFEKLNPITLNKNIIYKIPWVRRYFVKDFYRQIWPHYLDFNKYDIYHPLSQFIDTASLPKNCKMIFTAYDITPLVHKGEYPEHWIKRHTDIKQSIDRASSVICISKQTQSDLMDAFNIPKDKLKIIYLGLEQSWHDIEPPPQEKRGNYILFVGVHGPRKNIAGLIKSFNIVVQKNKGLSLKLVGAETEYTVGLKKLSRGLGLSDKIDFIGPVNDQQLKELYCKARGFVFPSFYEGFGLPLLEAMACGTPVVCSNRGALPEIGKKHCTYFNPNNIEEMSDKITYILNNPNDMISKMSAAKEYCRQFTWQRTAVETQKVYESII